MESAPNRRILVVDDQESILEDFRKIFGVDEEAASLRNARAAFFGVRNFGDRATQLSADQLVEPLAARMRETAPKWTVSTVLRDEASKTRLGRLLGGDETPAVLFTASHGMGFPNGHECQLDHQGALLCQDWPGLRHRGPIPSEFYFAGEDVGDDADLANADVVADVMTRVDDNGVPVGVADIGRGDEAQGTPTDDPRQRCDIDRDGMIDIFDGDDDGDGSGSVGDAPCRGGQRTGCDDNCVDLPNAGQQDADGDAIGDAIRGGEGAGGGLIDGLLGGGS